MRTKSLISILLVTFVFVSMVPFQYAFADGTALPDTSEELLALNTEVLKKLCNTSSEVYPFGLGEYHCPEDMVPGSYIIYVFGSTDTIFSMTELIFTEPNGNTSSVAINKSSMTALKVLVQEGDSFSLLQGDNNYFGVQCFIARWQRIGE